MEPNGCGHINTVLSQYGFTGVVGMKRKSFLTKHRFAKGNRLSQLLYTFSLVFLLLGLFLLAWSVWPAPTDGVQINIPAGPLPGAPGEVDFSSLSNYALNISWQRWMRLGEEGLIHLRLTDLERTSPINGEAGSVQIVLMEPALHPLLISPPGLVQANLGDDQELLLSWAVTATSPGEYSGKMFVSFGFFQEEDVVDEGSQQALTTIPIAVVDLNVRVIELWGLEPGLVIWFGLVSLVLWGVLFILGRVAARR